MNSSSFNGPGNLVYDVLIAGYGPTGAVAANLLGAYGFKVLVVEPNLEIYDIPRAVHFDGEVMRIFHALQLADEISELADQGKMIRFTNGRNWHLFKQDLSTVPRHHGWYNNLFFNQPQLEKCLRAGVSRYDNVAMQLGWVVSDLNLDDKDRIQLQLDSTTQGADQTESVSARYVLACDGASSSVRKILNISQEDLGCDEPWLVCDLLLEERFEFDRTGFQICDPARPTTLIPCEGNHIRWEFMLNAGEDAAVMEDEANVRALMAPHMHRLSPSLNDTDGDLIRAKVYTFHALLADTFQQDRVFLLGDAAHQTPPFLGQGLCAGVRDAYNLCWKLNGVMKGDYSVGVLKTYTTERRPHVREVIATAVAHGSIIQTRNPLKALVRDSYLMLGRMIPPLVGFLKFGEGWNLGAGLLATHGAPAAGGPVGEPLPQGFVQRLGVDEPPQWFDELLGGGFTLVGFGVDPVVYLADVDDHAWLSTVHIGSAGGICEIEGEMMHWAAEHAIALALVRPDRQVYGVCKTGSRIAVELQTMLVRLNEQLSRG
jgi:3-(3-hydroxy-phenyl)propionate hydroxylase